jgi:hypothetical protein
MAYAIPHTKQKMSLWVQHETPGRTSGPTKVEMDGSEFVDDFVKEIKKEICPCCSCLVFLTPGGKSMSLGCILT